MTSFTTEPLIDDCWVTVSYKAAAAPGAVTAVPTLGQWGLMLLAAGLGARRLRA